MSLSDKKINCPRCGGSGMLLIMPCFRCIGRGYIKECDLRWPEMTEEQKERV